MKRILISLYCLLAVVTAQWDWQLPTDSIDIVYEHLPNGHVVCRINCHRPLRQCPQVTCPQPNTPNRPSLNPQCPIAVCNEQTQHLLFPTPDPNTFYQCPQRGGRGNWDAIEMNCGCQTQFDYEQQRCVHPHEFRRQCVNTPVPVPQARRCTVNGAPPNWPPNQQPIHPPIPPIQPPIQIPESNPPWLPPQFPPAQNPVTDPPGPETTTICQCPPCVWWPCDPCDCN